MIKDYKAVWLWIEFILLFIGVPLLILFDIGIIHPSSLVLPVLIGIIIYLRRNSEFKTRDLIRFGVHRKELFKHGIAIILVALTMFLVLFFFDRDNLFNLGRANWQILLVLCFFYPVFSAYGQEVIYRLFLFNRYKYIFKEDKRLVWASSIVFSFVHIVYYSHVSIILTLLLGLYLSKVYVKTKSVLLTAILHGIYGNLVFIIGLGQYFWLDMHEWM